MGGQGSCTSVVTGVLSVRNFCGSFCRLNRVKVAGPRRREMSRISLKKAYLCLNLDCESVGENGIICEGCGGNQLFPLTKWIQPGSFCPKCQKVHGTGVSRCEDVRQTTKHEITMPIKGSVVIFPSRLTIAPDDKEGGLTPEFVPGA